VCNAAKQKLGRGVLTRLFVISNRVAPIEEGKMSAGGLSVAVEDALNEVGGIWFGWSGKVEASGSNQVRQVSKGQITYATMPLLRKDYDQYYKGFANSTLWPLLHYRSNLVENHLAFAEGYRRVNQQFAQKLSKLLKPSDIIWVHDYHLMLVARDLRALGVRNRFGFFLHTPFPPPEIFMACSAHAELIKGLMNYDLIGFQTEIDTRNFYEYVRREAGGSIRGRKVEAYGRTSRVRSFPISINPQPLQKAAAEAAGSYQTRQLVRSLGDKHLIIGVDRLDYSKGLDNRFGAYEMLLSHYPDNCGQVCYMQIAPPSRTELPHYREIRSKLEGMAGHINGKFAEFDWVPIRYLNKSFNRDLLMGFFRSARVGLVTPLRDGMNLVAKEYVAAQDPEDPGVLILSKFAGAAQELKSAIIVNPYDVDAMAEAMQRALTMKSEERKERWQAMMKVLQKNNLGLWRKNFLSELENYQER
jgi:trehalose 6-phosphate synthase